MRTFGRVTDPATGLRYWVEVGPDARGFLDSIYLTTLCQVLQLNLGESPFYGDWGIPGRQAVNLQIEPDYYVALTQRRFSPFFMYLGVVKRDPVFPPQPTYDITVRFQNGATTSVTVIPVALVDGEGLPITDGNGNPITIGTQTGRYVAQ